MTIFEICFLIFINFPFHFSSVAPISYAHHAAAQMGQFLKFDELSEASLSPDSEGNIPIPELPRLHKDVRTSMFFC
jgi:eukaryotic translation initiation factor 2C